MAVIKIVPMPGAEGQRGEQGETGPQGPQGNPGAQGPAGANAVWYYNGAYNSGAAYAVGDIVTYEGQTWYRKNANGGNVGDTPSEGLFWDLIAAKGEPGLDGLEGEQGPQGEPGPQGEQGIQGIQGEPGESTLSNLTRWTPNFTATGLTYTGSNSTHPCYNSYYVKSGHLVSFYIQIDLSTVTNFGSDQYKVELPFTPHGTMMNHFSGWVNVDPSVNPDNAGHVILNADHLVGTNVLDLHYIKQSGGANSPIMEAIFKQGTPVVLTTSSKIYINGTYISAE
jgi:hypothetical protein